MIKNKILPLLTACMLMTASVSAQADSTGVWTGVDLAPDSYYIYLGAMTALQGQDISSKDGWLLRLDAGYGEYDYNTAGVPGGNVDGDVVSGALMAGYRHFFDKGTITGFLGGEIQNHDQSPRDPANSIDGSEGGVKGQVELAMTPVEHIDFKAYGNYSTAFDSYWTYATVGYNFGSFVLGPEVRALGNEEFHQVRFGASLSQIDVGFASVALAAGYAENNGRGDDGAYGGIGFARNF